jgi:hypothetical protein
VDDITRTLVAQWGPLGVVVMSCAVAITRLYKDLAASREQRVTDVQLATVKLLELVNAQHEIAGLQAKALDSVADETAELRTLLRTIAERQPPPRGGR